MKQRSARFGNFEIWIYIDVDGTSRARLATCENFLYALDVFWAIVHRYLKDDRHIWVEIIENNDPFNRNIYETACNKGDECTLHGKYRDVRLRREWQNCPIEQLSRLPDNTNEVYRRE